jgi:hypothetical protein
MKWEYKHIIWSPTYSEEPDKWIPNPQEKYMNEMGAEGWELCGLVHYDHGVYNFFFKRKIV